MDERKFDDYAHNYDAALAQGLAVSGEDKDYFAQGRVRWLRRRLRQLGIVPRRALDFGCGTGSATPFLRNELGVQQLIGVDVSEASLQQARDAFGSSQTEFYTPSEYSAQLGAPFDLVFCNGVFHHIAPEKRAAALHFIRANMTTRGVFALWENSAWNPATRYVMSRCPFDDDALPIAPPQARAMLRHNGFRVLRTDYQFIFPRALAALRFLEAPLATFPFGTQYLVLARRD